MPQVRPLYNNYAEYYDLLHSQKNYANEVKKLKKVIDDFKISSGDDLLDVACGTGRHLSYFKNYFTCSGIDFHKSMLKVARRNVKNVTFKQADMETFKIQKQFDIISCLYGGISYTLSLRKLQTTLANFVRHLKPGGVVIIEPYFSEKQFTPNKPTLSTIERKNIKIARLSLSWRKGNLASRKMIMTIVEKDEGVFSFEDTRDIALFSRSEILQSMKDVGLKTIRLKNQITSDFDLYVGVKI